MMRRERAEFRRHERFSVFHSALLVFFMDAAGSSFVRGCTGGQHGFWMLAWVPLLGLTFYGWGLLMLQRREGHHYLVFGVLLAGVNAAWALATFRLRDPEDALRPGFLWVAGVLGVFGGLVTLHALLMRKRTGSVGA